MENHTTKPTTDHQQFDLFRSGLPRKPYCANDLAHGLRIRSAASAITHRYIQPNHPNSKLWLLFDVDRPTCPYEVTDDLGLPAPTLFIQNKRNHHAHLLYALETPVHMNESSSLKAIRFAGAVDVSLSQSLDADAGYVGLIAKNPLHEDWRTYAIASQYDLEELAEYLDLGRYRDRRKHLPEIGLGRNCTLFDRTRRWAYKAVREYFDRSYNDWLDEVETQALCYNTGFDSPLPFSEVRATAKSIAKYTRRVFTPGAFSAIQSERGKRSGQKRLFASQDKREQALDLSDSGVSHTEIARIMGVSRPTIYAWINDNHSKSVK